MQAHLQRAAEVKGVIEWVMGNIDGCYAADSVVVVGGQISEIPVVSAGSDSLVVSNIPYSFPWNATKSLLLQGRINEASCPNTSTNFL